MADRQGKDPFEARMPEWMFRELSKFIHSRIGVKLPPSKKLMLEGRLRKRLRHLGLKSFEEYHEFLFSPRGMKEELPAMVDVVTTHKTDFFREPSHFDYLAREAVPELLSTGMLARGERLLVWSAGCSTGQEPYTIAMVLHELSNNEKAFRYAVLATDVSRKVIETGKKAIYPEETIDPVPDSFRKKYFLRSKDKTKRLVRVVPELRAKVSFHTMNFLEDSLNTRRPFHIVFCRNVIIYFDRPTQEMILNKLCNYLIPKGYVFMGHSETIHGLDVPLAPAAPTVYRKAA